MDVRDVERSEIDWLAHVWHDGWREAHIRILPAELARLRTLDSFRERLKHALSRIRVIGPVGDPLGFCMTKDAETRIAEYRAEREAQIGAELDATATG